MIALPDAAVLDRLHLAQLSAAGQAAATEQFEREVAEQRADRIPDCTRCLTIAHDLAGRKSSAQ
ncbi:hypothetical protein [Rhodococcus sp. LB1]|uniref:hypothetical protein n=1 Tax=Rhodococcus sp. LB1 TaxID=1807499 RepID=UPI0012E936E3|nr:hypothetical protein [Rhodococcus sp. LB1]